jgi:hypothetical protein
MGRAEASRAEDDTGALDGLRFHWGYEPAGGGYLYLGYNTGKADGWTYSGTHCPATAEFQPPKKS